MRVEGDWWVAYYAHPHTMDGALILGTIRMAILAKQHRKDEFMLLMKGAIADLLFGANVPAVAWPDPPQRAPEHERGGSA